MAFQTSGRIEIEAPPARVFGWLTERDKLKAWTGTEVELMPADSAELRVGYRGEATFQGPDGEREMEIEVTAYDPPKEFGFTETYAGGKSVASYRLSDSRAGTVLELDASTDAAAPATEVPDEVEAQIDQLPIAQQRFAREQLQRAIEQTASVNIEANPSVQAAMQSQVDAQLEKLKELVELMEKED